MIKTHRCKKKEGRVFRNYFIVILLFDAPAGHDHVYDVMIGRAGLHYPECNAIVSISVDGFVRSIL